MVEAGQHYRSVRGSNQLEFQQYTLQHPVSIKGVEMAAVDQHHNSVHGSSWSASEECTWQQMDW
jgi:hypothetical protein